MTRVELESLRTGPGGPCVRLLRFGDGSVLTSDHPRAEQARSARRLILSAAASLAMACWTEEPPGQVDPRTEEGQELELIEELGYID